MVCIDCGNTTTVTSRSATARFTYMKLVNRLVSGLLYKMYITKMFPTRASRMIVVCRIAEDILTSVGYNPGGGAEEAEKWIIEH